MELNSELDVDITSSNDASTLIEKMCPLCGAAVRYFLVNYTLKVLMCEDEYCEFPFGYEPLQFINIDSDLHEVCLQSMGSSSPTATSCLSQSWTDLERLGRIYDSEGSSTDGHLKNTVSYNLQKRREKKRKQEEIRKNLENIRQLNLQLNEFNTSEYYIKKENWLKNLMHLQGFSGVQLLKEEEIQKLKKNEPDFGLGELKINITPDEKSSIINIEVFKTETRNENETLKTKGNAMNTEDKVLEETNEIDTDCQDNTNQPNEHNHCDTTTDKRVDAENSLQNNTQTLHSNTPTNKPNEDNHCNGTKDVTVNAEILLQNNTETPPTDILTNTPNEDYHCDDTKDITVNAENSLQNNTQTPPTDIPTNKPNEDNHSNTATDIAVSAENSHLNPDFEKNVGLLSTFKENNTSIKTLNKPNTRQQFNKKSSTKAKQVKEIKSPEPIKNNEKDEAISKNRKSKIMTKNLASPPLRRSKRLTKDNIEVTNEKKNDSPAQKVLRSASKQLSKDA